MTPEENAKALAKAARDAVDALNAALDGARKAGVEATIITVPAPTDGATPPMSYSYQSQPLVVQVRTMIPDPLPETATTTA